MSRTLRHSLSPNSPLLTQLLQRISLCLLYPANAASLLYSPASHTLLPDTHRSDSLHNPLYNSTANDESSCLITV
jgi:hypothetical protein